MTALRAVLPLAIAAMAVLPAASAPVSIVVDLGDYPSAEAAANDEENVNWRDADQTDDVRCTQTFAATELQRYLRHITGRADDFGISDDDQLPAGDLILVGGPKSNAATRQLRAELGLTEEELEQLGPEGYRLKRVAAGGREALVIAGGGRVGTLYGAYDLLYRLGCRWFAPGERHEEIPSLPLDSLPDLEVAEQPAFRTRGFHAWENRGDQEFLLWMARNRCNYWCHEQEDRALMHKLGIMMSCGGHVLTPWYISPRREYPYDHPKHEGDEGKPADPYPLGADFAGDANGDGKLSYSEAHPEWYAFRDGKRSFDISDWGGGDNFCTSNQHALAEFVKGAVQDLIDGRHADADIVNAWMLDGGKWCECDECKALGSRTDRNLLVVHALAQGIKQAQAEKRINRPIRLLFLAYADVLEPATHALPEGFDYDVGIATYFPIVRCYVHTLDDPACARNRRYLTHLQGWAVEPARHYQGQLCIGEYYNVSGYKCLPVCYMHSMAHDIPLYYRLGARHFHYMHCTTGNWGNKALTNYQLARQLWDPGTDCEALWRDYFTRYGPAAPTMWQFYETLEVMLSNVSELKYNLARRLDRGEKNLFPSSHLQYEKTEAEDNDGIDLVEMLEAAKRCRELIDGALQGELPPRVRARVEEDERLFTYGERTLRFFDALCRAFFAAREGEQREARAAYKEAQDIAELLKADEASTKLSSSHANAPNALSASYAAGALTHLMELLGPDPDQVKAFSPDAQPLVLTGRDFFGGGATKYGYGLHRYPGRIKVSDDGNWVYGAGTGAFDHMTAFVRFEKPPGGPLYLTLYGLKCAQPPGGDVAGAILVNEQEVFSGPVPFTEDGLTQQQVTVPAELWQPGLNRIKIQNTQLGGHVGQRPWFGIDRIELRTEPLTADPQSPTVE